MELLDWETNQFVHEAKNPDTAENFARVCERVNARITPLGLPYRRDFPAPVGLPKVAFFLSGTSLLAHVQGLLAMLRGLDQLEPAFAPYIIAMGKENAAFRAAMGDRPVMRLDEPQSLAGWQRVQSWGHENGLAALVHVSSAIGLAFASAMRCAHRHVWWSMKWRYDGFPHVDAHIDSTGGIVAPPWVSTYTALKDLYRPDLSAKAKDVRSRLSGGPIFGTMCREEKFTPEFVEAVRRILERVPGARFLYTGHNAVPALDALGAKYIGWVKTPLWAQVIEIFLDTWPFACGYTAWEAVAAHKPLVMMEPPAKPEQAWVAGQMRAVGHRYHAAKNLQEYVDTAVRMARGELSEFIDTNHAFYMSYMRDEKRMAREFTAALLRAL